MSKNIASAPRALVVGGGIAGPTVANALSKAGWAPTIVEKAPERRKGGYFVGVFASGRRTAERLGILKYMTNRTPTPSINYEGDRLGNRKLGISFSSVPGGPWMTVRGDVEEAAFAALDPAIPVHFSTTPTKIEQIGKKVRVELHNTATNSRTEEEYDLVIGADGLRSTVRQMVFGPHSKYLRRLNAMLVAYELRSEIPGIPQGEGYIIGEVGHTFAVYPFKDRPPTVLWSYKTNDVDAEFTQPLPDRLRQVYGPEPLGPIMERALEELQNAPQFVFDSVEQPVLDTWYKGRVVLVGDSAWCPTLYSGLGISAAFAGGELLAHELKRSPGNVEQALQTWEAKFRPYAEFYQEMGRKNQFVHAPASEKELKKRNFLTKLRASPLTGRVLGFLLSRSKQLKRRNHDFITGDT
ncbi:FAD-dependent monooxygenase [Sphingobium sp. CFD-2]|uniref:FAD-dependent monooxygenase n=1 Tax=Sphingobium sp. CFD-2 TaxID=2878542 RepID=UPI00214C37F3|nr:FAD-dependent monooxygenase [Sphingobium sp. CFD-2]